MRPALISRAQVLDALQEIGHWPVRFADLSGSTGRYL